MRFSPRSVGRAAKALELELHEMEESHVLCPRLGELAEKALNPLLDEVHPLFAARVLLMAASFLLSEDFAEACEKTPAKRHN